MKQKLSPTALKAKRVRDKKAAMTSKRKARKASAQKKRRNTPAFKLKGKDVHHTEDGKLVLISTSSNRDVWKRNER